MVNVSETAKEKNRRRVEARRRADKALAHRHPEEYAALVERFTQQVDAERGPLPGEKKNGEQT